MSFNFDPKRELQPPGAGIPTLERNFLNFVFKTGSFCMSFKSATRLFQRESETLFRLANEDESYDVFHPLLIPRVIGIEDSSRKWSVMMVLEHLNMVNRDIINGIAGLMEGIAPRGEVATEFYKPSAELDYSVLSRFAETNAEYVQRIDDLASRNGTLKSSARHAHPWFGRLNAHQWHCLAAVHQRIHRRQAQKIVAMLGVA